MLRLLRLTLALAWLLGSGSFLIATEPSAPAHEVATAEHATSTGSHTTSEASHGAVHHAPEVRLFGHSLGTLGQFGLKFFNFAIFVGLLYGLLKAALASAFKTRAQEIQDRLDRSEREKAEAEAQMQALESRMAQLQQELDTLMARAEADAAAEKARILETARAEAEQILAQAQQEIAHHQRMAEQELRALVAQLAVEGAEARLRARVQGDVATNVLDRAIHQLGGTL